MSPTFSPDGKYIAYIRRNTTTDSQLYVMPVANGVTQNPNSQAVQQQALAPYAQSAQIIHGENLAAPVWSPDGTQIAYIGYANGVFDLWLLNVTKDAKKGSYSAKGDPIQLTDSKGQLDADSHAFWTK
jgi:Tol biopolymer transport system component